MCKTHLKKIGHLVFYLFLFINTVLSAQTPPNNLSGEDLRVWLKTNWYDGQHTTLGYDGVDGARSYMYNIIDNHDDSVACVYSGYKAYRLSDLTRAAGTTGMTPINCEHSIPQSFFSSNEPMKSDIHHLYPAYENWNSTRQNFPFAEINDNEAIKWMYLDSSQTFIPASNIELWSEFKSGFFEPREDHKGNLARAIFYFYTMYPNEAGDLSLLGDLITFYDWHLNDQPDALEYQRDDDIFLYQGNANPYLSNDGWIRRVFDVGTYPPPGLALSPTTSTITVGWGDLPTETGFKLYRSTNGTNFTQLGSTLSANTVSYTDTDVAQGITYYYYIIATYGSGDSQASEVVNGVLLAPQPPSAVTDLALAATTNSLILNWNDVTGETYYQVYRSTDNNSFSAFGGQLPANTASYSDNTATSGSTYYYYIVAGNGDGISTNSNTVSGSLLTTPEYASDLIISEYVEGSSFNKAIELANFTGAPVNLSNYELGKQTNGAGTWTKLSLSGTLAHGSTYVVAENSATPSLLAQTDLSTGSTVMTFNGNDPVALFKNNGIIDIIGTENGGSGIFAENVTMVRNANIFDPNPIYTISEWTVYELDDFTHVGAHSMNISGASLPVELNDFIGKSKPNFNLLEWRTDSELNSDYFEIEKSTDGIIFYSIGKVSAMGNSNKSHRYEFVENDPAPFTYYRLKQTDKDGQFIYSKIISVRLLETQTNTALSPSPATDHVILHLETSKNNNYEIRIIDMAGRILFSKNYFTENSYNQFMIPLNGFENGVYILETKNEFELVQMKFVKVGR